MKQKTTDYRRDTTEANSLLSTANRVYCNAHGLQPTVNGSRRPDIRTSDTLTTTAFRITEVSSDSSIDALIASLDGGTLGSVCWGLVSVGFMAVSLVCLSYLWG